MQFSKYARQPVRSSRRGSISVLSAFCLVIVMMMAAFAVDMGYLMVAKADLQRAADAAAQSAVLDYRTDGNLTTIFTTIRNSAKAGVEANPILRDSATSDLNYYNADLDGDIVLGRIDFDQTREQMTFESPGEYNAVKVRVRRSLAKNGGVPLFFGRIFGYQSIELEASATAALINNVSGFKIPPSGKNAPILPITISITHWNRLIRSGSHDEWSYDAENQVVKSGSDKIPEVVIFPIRNGSGNLGTLNIGTNNNSTGFLGKQIRKGISQRDMDFHGGSLELNESSVLKLSGNPGLSAAIGNDLATLTGQIRVIPIYNHASGSGNNLEYSIVRFEAVRIMAVQLSGGEKVVSVQPAKLSIKGLIQSSSPGTSSGIFSPPVIVQ